MIIKYTLVRLVLIFLLVIIFPMVQNQWLNLYLFDDENFSFYKILYYLGTLVCPMLVCVNSINQFTYYKFINSNKQQMNITGKTLFITTFLILIIFSTLTFYYIILNIELFVRLFISSDYIFKIEVDKQIFFMVIISICLFFSKTKFLIKKIVLLNFFMITMSIWYSKINNLFINEILSLPDFLKFENINFFFNIVFLLIIETLYYLWSYISNSSNLSDWIVPKAYIKDFTPILNIVIFYIMIIFYYSILIE